ncbi:hypothetical protein M0811_07234 [Anaeramoeba ignava]|uniref:Uncharacterized protein n=1 Tax=Anaeramoeba ignava TaxID=1746090 RepID=A0A9Q0LNK7_ANAIG|nr:hypothetical protein M0811_07234 [Anaeramoeba ignava]
MLFLSDVSIFSLIHQLFSDSILLYRPSLMNSFSQQKLNLEEKIDRLYDNDDGDFNSTLSIIQYCLFEGKNLIIFDYPEIYTFIYQLFSSFRIEENGIFSTHLFVKNETRRITVNKRFRLVVVVTNPLRYELQHPDFLDCFEKHFVDHSFLEKTVSTLKADIIQNVESILKPFGKFKPKKIPKEELIVAFNSNLSISLTLKYEQNEILIKKKLIQFCKFEKMVEIRELLKNKKKPNSNSKQVQEIIDLYFNSFYKNFDDLFTKEIIHQKIKNSIIFTRTKASEYPFLKEQYNSYSFININFQTSFGMDNKLIDQLVSKIDKTEIVTFAHFTQSQAEDFYKFKLILDEIILQNEKRSQTEKTNFDIANHFKKEKKQCYFILVIHLTSNTKIQEFPFCFEKNWEHYYVEELFPKLPLQNLPDDLSSFFILLQENKFDDLWKNMAGLILSRNFSFMHEKYFDLVNFIQESFLVLKKDLITAKIGSMIQNGIKENHYIYKFNIADFFQKQLKEKEKEKEKEKTFHELIYEHFMDKMIEIIHIFFTNINLNGNLLLALLSSTSTSELSSKHKNRRKKNRDSVFWKIFEKFQVPWFEIKSPNSHNFEMQADFSSIIFSLLFDEQKKQNQNENNKKESVEKYFFPKISLITYPFDNNRMNKFSHNKQEKEDAFIQKYFQDWAKLMLDTKQKENFDKLNIDFVLWIKKILGKEEKNCQEISLKKACDIFIKQILPNLYHLIEISPLVISEKQKDYFSFQIFMKTLITNFNEKNPRMIIKVDSVESLFRFFIEIECKKGESSKKYKNLYKNWEIQKLRNANLSPTLLETLLSKSSQQNHQMNGFSLPYKRIKDEMRLDIISVEYLNNLFNSDHNHKKFVICPKSKQKPLIYLNENENENENEKCPICQHKLHKKRKHFHAIKKKDIQKYREDLIEKILQFARFLSFYGNILFERFLFDNKFNGFFNFQKMKSFVDFCIEQRTLFSFSFTNKNNQNPNEVFDLIFAPLLNNIFSLEFDKTKDFINEILQTKNSDIIFLSLSKFLIQNEEILHNLSKNWDLNENMEINLDQQNYNLEEVVRIINKRNDLMKNPEDIDDGMKEMLMRDYMEPWLKFVFYQIEIARGRDHLREFVKEKFSSYKKKNSLIRTIMKNKKRGDSQKKPKKKEEDQSLFDLYEAKQTEIEKSKSKSKSKSKNKRDSQESIDSWFLRKDISQLKNIFKDKKEIFLKPAILTLELISKSKLEPFTKLLSFHFVSKNYSKETHNIQKIYFPAMGGYPFTKWHFKNRTKWKVCKAKHLNWNLPVFNQLNNICQFCNENLEGSKVNSHFFDNARSYFVPCNPNTNLGFKIRQMHPVTFRIIRLFTHLSAVLVAVLSPKFLSSFIEIMNDYIFKPRKEQLIDQLFAHIENDFLILSELLFVSVYQASLYYIKFLDLIQESSILKDFLNFDEFENIETRNNFEKMFNDIYKQNDKIILSKIKKITEDEIVQKLEQSPDLKIFLIFQNQIYFPLRKIFIKIAKGKITKKFVL